MSCLHNYQLEGDRFTCQKCGKISSYKPLPTYQELEAEIQKLTENCEYYRKMWLDSAGQTDIKA